MSRPGVATATCLFCLFVPPAAAAEARREWGHVSGLVSGGWKTAGGTRKKPSVEGERRKGEEGGSVIHRQSERAGGPARLGAGLEVFKLLRLVGAAVGAGDAQGVDLRDLPRLDVNLRGNRGAIRATAV